MRTEEITEDKAQWDSIDYPNEAAVRRVGSALKSLTRPPL